VRRQRPFAGEPIQEVRPRLRVGEALGCKRHDAPLGRVRRVSEQLLERGVGDDRGAVLAAVGTDRTHEHAFVHGVEQTPEGLGAAVVYRDDLPTLKAVPS
jgi:hypothetical protein